ncbi:MAG: protein kinase [Minicystis sp.]
MIADRFRLERPLGQGGMGEVWLSHHISLDIPCAIKFIFAEAAADEDLRARFDREAKIAAQIRSPHVVQILDNGIFQGAPYIAMELLEGEDLAQRLERLGRLDPQSTAAIVAQVARALSKAHAAGLVHRDLKPANIFLVRDDDREIVKVLDFGIAKSSSLSLGAGGLSATKTGSLLGTPVYMSPEQAQGTKAVDHRTDLWALGVVTFECLTGRLPFDSPALGDLFMKIMVEPLPIPSQIAALPPSFDAWWSRAAARYPDQRFQSAKELVDALHQAFGLTGDRGSISRVGPISAQGFSPPSAQGFAPPSAQAAWSNPQAATALSPYGAARPLTAGPVVAALSTNEAPRPGSSLVAPVIAGVLSLGLVVFLVLFLVLRPTSAPVVEGSGSDSSRDATSASPSASTAPPIVSAASPPIVPSAAASVAPTPSAKAPPPPSSKPPPVGPTKTPPVKPKRPDFGI